MITVFGLPQAIAALGAVALKGQLAAEAGKAALASGVAATASSLVAVDTGATKESIEITDEGVVASEAAVFLEFGTVHMGAQPFMRPAADGAEALEGAIAAAAKRVF